MAEETPASENAEQKTPPDGALPARSAGGGVIFYAAGRHPLAGIGAAFAGVSGGFSANFIPSGIDPLLQGLTQAGAQILDPAPAAPSRSVVRLLLVARPAMLRNLAELSARAAEYRS